MGVEGFVGADEIALLAMLLTELTELDEALDIWLLTLDELTTVGGG